MSNSFQNWKIPNLEKPYWKPFK